MGVHKICFDVLMPRLSGSAWKVLCFIIRKTIGYQKEFDKISYSQISTGTGLKSHETIRAALMELRGHASVKQGRRINGWRRVPELPELVFTNEQQGMKESACYWLNQNVEILLPDSRSTFNVERSTLNVETINKPNNKESSSNYYSRPSNSYKNIPESFNNSNDYDFSEAQSLFDELDGFADD